MNVSVKNIYGFLFKTIILLYLLYPLSVNSKTKDTNRLLELFGEAMEKTHQNYVEEITEQELIEKAINGMLSGLDPHSGYMNEAAFKEMQVDTSGKFGGLGIQITMEEGLVKIISPIDDTPAYKAGLKAGDYITKIDGKQIFGLTLTEAVDLMRGEPGSKIIITIAREGADIFDVIIIRDIIKVQSVRYEVYNNVGYIRISSFTEQTTDGIKKAIKNIKSSKTNQDTIGYVLDLRSNPGGLLSQAINTTDLFLKEGIIVSTKGRKNKSEKNYKARGGDILNGQPVVVIINNGSASASEIVAGALQDHNRAIIIGTKSFGKGSVQTIIPLRDSYRNKQGAMRLTTARYFTPSGKSIQAKGIDPDIIIEQGKFEANNFEVYSESDLMGSLDGDNSNRNTDNLSDKFDNLKKDYQLSRAIDLVNVLLISKKS